MSGEFPDLSGKTCARVTKIRHHYRDQPDSTRGPLQFDWADGTCSTVDARTDLTVAVSEAPWVDPYAHVVGDQRTALEREIGLWEPRLVDRSDPLYAVVGQTVRSVEPIVDAVDLLVGVRIQFEDLVVIAQIVDTDDWDIDVTIEAL